ncbi:MAG: nucleoside deaminase [Actinomycetota bacterium]
MSDTIPTDHHGAALEESWQSWCGGSWGIGAVLVDPATDEIVSRGRNRMLEQPTEPRTVAGNFMAHAEMNAYAALPRLNAEGLHLYTTLEPCLMCAATTLMMRVEHVHFAAADEFMDWVDGHWDHHEFTAERRAPRSGPLGGKAGEFARLLPLTFVTLYLNDTEVGDNARATRPELMALAAELHRDGALTAVKNDGGDVYAAFAAIADRLPG